MRTSFSGSDTRIQSQKAVLNHIIENLRDQISKVPTYAVLEPCLLTIHENAKFLIENDTQNGLYLNGSRGQELESRLNSIARMAEAYSEIDFNLTSLGHIENPSSHSISKHKPPDPISLEALKKFVSHYRQFYRALEIAVSENEQAAILAIRAPEIRNIRLLSYPGATGPNSIGITAVSKWKEAAAEAVRTPGCFIHEDSSDLETPPTRYHALTDIGQAALRAHGGQKLIDYAFSPISEALRH